MERRQLLLAAIGLAAASLAMAQSFSGKTVTIIVGYKPGGGYDATARLLARHLPKHIPGKPTVIVQTMLGGGGLVALNHLAKIAPQDGTVLSLPHANIVQDGLPDVIPPDACTVGWQESLTLLANLVEPEIPG